MFSFYQKQKYSQNNPAAYKVRHRISFICNTHPIKFRDLGNNYSIALLRSRRDFTELVTVTKFSWVERLSGFEMVREHSERVDVYRGVPNTHEITRSAAILWQIVKFCTLERIIMWQCVHLKRSKYKSCVGCNFNYVAYISWRKIFSP